MTDLSFTRAPGASVLTRVAVTVGVAVLGSLRAVARYAAAEIDRRRTSELLGFDDSQLRDIGLSRGDVYGALLTSAGEKPSHRLAVERDARRTAERDRLQELRRTTRS